MINSIIVMGAGKLLEYVNDRLHDQYEIKYLNSSNDLLNMDKNAVPLAILSLNDYRAISIEIKIQKIALELGIPYLRAHLYTDTVFIGPWISNGLGCLQCVEDRQAAVHANRKLWNSVKHASESDRYLHSEKPWSIPFLENVTLIIEEDLARLSNNGKCRLIGKVYIGNDTSLRGQFHNYLSIGNCLECGSIPEDSSELMELKFSPCIKPHPREYRQKNNLLTIESLKELFLDRRLGVMTFSYRFNHINTNQFAPCTIVEMPVLGDPNYLVHGCGRTNNYKDAECIAFLEALERYAGCMMRGKKINHFGSYKDFEYIAINPREFGIYENKQMEENGFTAVPYHDELSFEWVWAYSWREQKTVLIPHQMIYYHSLKQDNIFIRENSNGCGMGGSLEEAIYHALIEVIERDAFLVAWYNRLPLTPINIEGAKDKNILFLRDRINSKGYKLHLFDITMDSNIPSVWAMLERENNTGFKTYSAAGAHSDPEKAIMGALIEVCTSEPAYSRNYLEKQCRALELVKDPSKVMTMEDHTLRFGHPEAVKDLNFLFKNKKAKHLQDIYKTWYAEEPPIDITEELKSLMNRLLKFNKDILIVDQTSPELEKVGVKAVKVIVLGMLTMTFGHQYRRINVQRIQNAPVQAGYRKIPLRIEEINLTPHPFP